MLRIVNENRKVKHVSYQGQGINRRVARPLIKISILIVFLILVTAIPSDSATLQGIDLTVDILDEEMTYNYNTSTDKLLEFRGNIHVTKPISRFVVVEVYLHTEVSTNFESNINPLSMTFHESGRQNFTATVRMPDETNYTLAILNVKAEARSTGFEPVEENDTAKIIIELPPEQTNGKDPDGNDTIVLTQPMILTSLGMAMGGGIAAGIIVMAARSRKKSSKRKRKK
jgi:hypothetical protein